MNGDWVMMIFFVPRVFLSYDEILLTFFDEQHLYKVSYNYKELSEQHKSIIKTIRLAEATGKKVGIIGQLVDNPVSGKSIDIYNSAIVD